MNLGCRISTIFSLLHHGNFHTKGLCTCPRRLSELRKYATNSVAPDFETDDILAEIKNNSGIITLDRRDKFNALSFKMINKINSQLQLWNGNPSVSLVILKGSNSEVFCAGGDAVFVAEASKKGNCQLFKDEYIMMHTLGTLSIPRIVLMEGITFGAGVGLAVNSTYRIATEKTLLSLPENALGLYVDWGGANFMPRLPGRLGWYIGLTGIRLKSRDVYKAGMATHFVDSAKIPSLERSLVSLRNPSCHDIEEVLNRFHSQSRQDLEKPYVLEPYLDIIEKVFDGQTIEEIFSKLEEDGSEWSKSQLQLLKSLCPTSLKLTLRHFQLGVRSSLAETLIREYTLSAKCTRDYNFYEGVRAVLLEKDNRPKWQPATVEEVTDDKLDWFFTPLPDSEAMKL